MLGSEVEIRCLPCATEGMIYRGSVSRKNGSIRTYSQTYIQQRMKINDQNEFNLLNKNCFDNFNVLTAEVYIDLEDVIPHHDIVLTTYSNLKVNKMHSLFQSIYWHRIVLDECQEIKIATNQIATMCANLSSQRRWMVSGTPLCSRVSDLHGELNFLKVWPFCLPNNEDGNKNDMSIITSTIKIYI
jgi:SNF2 family DNA or RNA helicase